MRRIKQKIFSSKASILNISQPKYKINNRCTIYYDNVVVSVSNVINSVNRYSKMRVQSNTGMLTA